MNKKEERIVKQLHQLLAAGLKEKWEISRRYGDFFDWVTYSDGTEEMIESGVRNNQPFSSAVEHRTDNSGVLSSNLRRATTEEIK